MIPEPPDSIPPPPPSLPPPSGRISNLPPPLDPPNVLETSGARILRFVEHMGAIASLTGGAVRSTLRRPLEITSTVYQIESLGVRSLGIVAVTSVFIGMVMTIQFAFGLQRFGGIEYIPRVIVLSFLRELGPTLTAIIVGGRIGSGMAAEVGAMN
ncbi:MAG TPA: ABC transporter permease, partial [Polyangiaceae bacterium]